MTARATVDARATLTTRRRYDRISAVYDRMEASVERRRFGAWRAMLWSQVQGPAVLEVGVGTGKNFPYYPPGLTVLGID
ncbi:MAG: SAM-dependent methyltransferase, partial [Chloroflexota bacterium]|nr:SAM-dependent methyltransferase [Chloroflexota bacterium]